MITFSNLSEDELYAMMDAAMLESDSIDESENPDLERKAQLDRLAAQIWTYLNNE